MSSFIERWVTVVLAVAGLVLTVGFATDGAWVWAVLWGALTAACAELVRRDVVPRRATTPPHENAEHENTAEHSVG